MAIKKEYFGGLERMNLVEIADDGWPIGSGAAKSDKLLSQSEKL